MNKIEAIADFLCNGLEHSSAQEASAYLEAEIGMDAEKAQLLVQDYLAKYSAVPLIPNEELFPFVEKYL